MLLIYSILGFMFFDAVYVAAVVNYAVQSEMNIYLLQSIKIRVLSRKYGSTDEAIKVSCLLRITIVTVRVNTSLVHAPKFATTML